MAPTFRSSRSGRQFTDNATRGRSGAADHDIFEGLPVRRWTRQNHTVSQDAQLDIPSSTGRDAQPDHPFPELPMPKDSHLLAPHSRALLRAARAGYIYLRPATKESQTEDEKELAEADETAPAAKMERSYTTRKWSQLPKHVELPEVEFLAKRRPGLPSLYGVAGTLTAAVPNAAQPMRKVKVKKIDSITGNITIYDAWVPEGQKVEGEIKDESQVAPVQQDATVTRVVPPPGAVVEGVEVANAEGVVVAPAAPESPDNRKGPPPPKRKGKGVGSKSRKRVMFAPGEGVDAGEGDPMAIDGEEDDDEEDEDGEEGEEGKDGGAEEKTPEEKTPQPGGLSSEPTPMVLDQSTTPNLQPPADDDMPSVTQELEQHPPISAVSPEKSPLGNNPTPQVSEIPEVEQAAKAEPSAPKVSLLEQPQSPIRPQSEQLTPPHLSSAVVQSTTVIEEETATTDPISQVETVQKAEEATTSIPPPEVNVSKEELPTAIKSKSVEPTAPTIENIETVENVQSTKEGPVVVQTETKIEPVQLSASNVEELPSAPITSRPPIQPSEVPLQAPQTGIDLLSSLASSLEKDPKQPEDSQLSPIPPPPVQDASEQLNSIVEPPSEPVVGPPPSEPIAAPVDAAPSIEKAASPIVAAQPVKITPPVEAAQVIDAAPPVEIAPQTEITLAAAIAEPVIVAERAPAPAPEPEPVPEPTSVPAENNVPEASPEAKPEPAEPVVEKSGGEPSEKAAAE